MRSGTRVQTPSNAFPARRSASPVFARQLSPRGRYPQGPRGSAGVAGTPVVAAKPAVGRGWVRPGVCGRGCIPIRAPSSISARTRLPVAGWVENRLSAPRPASGLMMNSCPEAGLRSAVGLWIRLA